MNYIQIYNSHPSGVFLHEMEMEMLLHWYHHKLSSTLIEVILVAQTQKLKEMFLLKKM